MALSKLQTLLLDKLDQYGINSWILNHGEKFGLFERDKTPSRCFVFLGDGYDMLMEFMIYLYIKKRNCDARPALKIMLTENYYKRVIQDYRAYKRKYHNKLYKERARLKKNAQQS